MKFRIYREQQFLGEFLHDEKGRNSTYIGTDPHIRGIWKQGIWSHIVENSSVPSTPEGIPPPIVDPIQHYLPTHKLWPTVFRCWAQEHGYTLKLVK